MESAIFIGIDITKATLDVSILATTDTNIIHYQTFVDNKKEVIPLLKWVKQNSQGVPITAWKVSMENTGMYSLELNCFLHKRDVWQCLENALQIMRSMGVTRGKTDKADSRTIALYAYHFSDRLKQNVLPSRTHLRLMALFAQRERLVGMHRQLQLAIKSLKGYAKELVGDIQKQNEGLLKNSAAQIKAIYKSLRECLKEDRDLGHKAKLVQSVPGIGLQTTAYLLVVSRGMESFDSSRQFACYSGCAPFEHSSGVSVRGKTKVHFIANRKMKFLLYMAAINAITFNKELKLYYQRTTAEGKNPMSMLNAVRFKLICRIFSVVKHAEPFKLDYQKIAALSFVEP
jgi:transposase